jgi:hypothetical protein
VDDSLLEVVRSSKEREATVIAGENRLNPELLSQDLKALVEGTWDWQVRRLSDTGFSVVFPTKDSLNMCKNLCKNAGGIALPISTVSVLFADPQPIFWASAQLAKVWVHLDGVPDCLRKKELLLEGTKMLGRPRMVNEDSLINTTGPVKMLFHSQAPDRMPKAVMLFTNFQGFRINVSVDNSKLSLPVFDAEEKKKDDENDDDEDGREQTEDQSISDHHWKRGSSKDKAKATDIGTSSLPAKGVAGAALPEIVTPPPAMRVSPAPPPAPIHQKESKKPGSKSSMGSSSMPLPSALDHSATKPTSSPC